MNKIILIFITIISLNSITAYSQTLKEKYNEQTQVSTKRIQREMIEIRTEEKKQEEPPKKARLERLRDKK